MNEVTRFRAPGGDEMVVVLAADDQRLLDASDDIADVAAHDRAVARLASGEEEMIPSEIVNRILDGESRIKVWREHRGLTSAALAAQAGIGQGFLSQIETGKRDGTLDTLRKIAGALRLTLDDLVG